MDSAVACGKRLTPGDTEDHRGQPNEILRTIRVTFHRDADALSDQAVGAGADASVRAGRSWIFERRSHRGNRRAARLDRSRGSQRDQLLLDADHQTPG